MLRRERIAGLWYLVSQRVRDCSLDMTGRGRSLVKALCLDTAKSMIQHES